MDDVVAEFDFVVIGGNAESRLSKRLTDGQNVCRFVFYPSVCSSVVRTMKTEIHFDLFEVVRLLGT